MCFMSMNHIKKVPCKNIEICPFQSQHIVQNRLAPIYGHAFLPITQSFLVQFRNFLYGYAQKTKTLLITFGPKIKMPNFRPIFGHGRSAQPNWRRGLKMAPKVSPMNGVFWPTHISNIIIPNKNQLLPSPLKIGLPTPSISQTGWIMVQPLT